MKKMTKPNTFLAVIITIVAASLMTSFIILGSPAEERERRLDDQRIRDLESIAFSIDRIWTDNKSLPLSLEELENSRVYGVQSIRDPESGEFYFYEVTEENNYDLCATFEAESSDRLPTAPQRVPAKDQLRFWNHPAGYHCFQVTAQELK